MASLPYKPRCGCELTLAFSGLKDKPRLDVEVMWSRCEPRGMYIAGGYFHGLNTCMGKVGDAYNHGQGHGITPIHAQ